MNVAFLGLGQMGEPMAASLLDAGFPLRVFNRSAAKAERLRAKGATLAASPADAAREARVVVTMLAQDAALEALALGPDGFAEAMPAGAIHVSMSTIAPETSVRLAERHAARGCAYVAAPVFGRPDAAAARRLWICQSGPAAAKQAVRPLLEAMGQGIFDFGEAPQAANVVKLCGNFLILSAVEAIAEALALARKSGVDPAALAAFVGQTMFACPIYQNYGRIVTQGQYEPAGFPMILGLKDVRLIQSAADAARVPMPLASLLRERVVASLAQGRDFIDWSGIAKVAAEEAGITDPPGGAGAG